MSKIQEYRENEEWRQLEEQIAESYEAQKRLWLELKSKFPLENDRFYVLKGNCLSFSWYEEDDDE